MGVPALERLAMGHVTSSSGAGGLGVARRPLRAAAPHLAACPEKCRGALGIGSIRVHIAFKCALINHLAKLPIRGYPYYEKAPNRLAVYPHGVVVDRHLEPAGEPPSRVPERGRIMGFSHKSARRLKYTFMTAAVEGFDLWAITLTTHAIMTPSAWRRIMMRFRVALIRAGWAGIWRVELQKRKAPHAHVAMWLPPGVGHDRVRALWLRCTGEFNDPEAVKNAVYSKRIQNDDTGWTVYMGTHDSKHKKEQLGWIGKQWGVWNAELFGKRDPLGVYAMGDGPYFAVLRALSKLDVARRWMHSQAEDRRVYSDLLSNGVTCIHWVPDKKPKRVEMHQGNLLRLLTGDVARRIIEGVLSGIIYPQTRTQESPSEEAAPDSGAKRADECGQTA